MKKDRKKTKEFSEKIVALSIFQIFVEKANYNWV